MSRTRAKLSASRERFCQEYLLDLNATKAYARAYPDSNLKSARTNGPRLLANAGIQERIQQLMEKRAERTEVSQDRVIKELVALAFSDLRRLARWDGNTVTLLDSQVIDPMAAKAVAEVGEGAEGRVRIKLHNKLEALITLGKHLGMFTERLQITGRDGAPLIPVQAVQAAIQDALAGPTPPEWMEGLVPAEEMALLFPGAFREEGAD